MHWDTLVRALSTNDPLRRGLEGLAAFIALASAASIRFRTSRPKDGVDGLD